VDRKTFAKNQHISENTLKRYEEFPGDMPLSAAWAFAEVLRFTFDGKGFIAIEENPYQESIW
jgi:hypothetical protein